MMRLGEAHEIPLIAMAGSGIGEGRGYTGTLAASLAVVPLQTRHWNVSTAPP
jgi:hypothetical protein